MAERSRETTTAGLKSERMEAALAKALDGAPAPLVDALERSSGMPGPRPNLDLARAVGAAIGRAGHKGLVLLDALTSDEKREYLLMVAAQGFAARLAEGKADAGEALQRLAEDPRRLVRDGVVDALRALLESRGEAGVALLQGWTDGYLQANVALSALADRALLARLPGGAGPEVLARLEEAFALADGSPRAAERLQGVRQLREGLAKQISVIAARFPEALGWLEGKARETERPESREVIAGAITVLRKEGFGQAEADRIQAVLAGSAPAPRDPSRVVQGTRKRSRGRK
ncbi:MAG TPA: hypothetical protein VLS89_04015 [Candidatus Nanopelagicales bacterium]|nr:hypothetical protein [Candidatus Nanopelagicales bacterium]